ncbi:hypothetical protein POM88_000584 [Heracleum sosnowskyi]|uniref:Ubiquitin-like protease family profile domain-containing protein n=1 Tax=Heracleum sosnowskyi TaxID=360622 RepID=A0AAD8JCI8_9APIA|nr:hypothetical protein POM88_000584 [Heracleum sosnowskyi]
MLKHHGPGYRKPNFNRPSMSYDEAREEFEVAEEEYNLPQVMEVEATAPPSTPFEIPSRLHDDDTKFYDQNVEQVELPPPQYASFQKSPIQYDCEMRSFTQYQHIFNAFNVNSTSPPNFGGSTNFLRAEDTRPVGLNRKGELTKPLKSIKVQWLKNHWWSDNVITESLVQPKLDYSLTQKQLKTLMPRCEIECLIVHAYLAQLRDREERNKFEGQDKIFFMDPMFWQLATIYCMKPHLQLESETKSMHNVFNSYRKQHEGPNIVDCTYISSGRRSSLRLSARRMTSSTTKSGKRKRPVSRINSEQLSTAEFEAYVQIVWKKIPITLRYRCLCIDSLYFKAYMERNNRENVISWMVRDGSFAQRYVFVPICQANHWSLLILCNFGKDFNNTARPCILLLDSLETREENIEPDVRKFVFAMYKKWKPESSSQHIHNIPFRKPKVPQQKDGNRCGYYVIFFIYRFLLDCMDEFNIDNDYPSFMTQDWFTQSEFDSFSENLSYVWQDVAYEDIQTAVDTEENAMKEDIAEKKGDDINKQTALVLYTPESSQEKDNIAQCDNINEETAIVLYTPESSQEKINIAHDEVKVQKKILKIKVKSVDVRRSPRLATPDAKRRAIEIEPVQLHGSRCSVTEAVKRRRIKTTPPMDARGTRSVARRKEGKRTAKRKRSERDDKRKKVEHLECIISTDAETESEQEVEEIKKARKRSATRKTNRRDVHNESSKRKTSKKKNDKTGKKKRNEGKQHIEMPKKLKLRAHPSKFSKAMENLSTDQKQWIKDAGFEDLLSFSFRHIPNEMARNVVWFYDPYHNWLNLADKKVIRITEDEVHRVLGLPKGSRKVIIGPANTETLEEWRDQYPERKAGHKITELSVMKAITRTGELNLKFKQNFMVLMYNLFIRCTTGSYVSQDVLKLVGSFDEVSEMNWCKLVVDGLKDASLAWLEDPTTQYYTGSLMFLIFFYLDRVQNEVIKVERKDTAFTGWSNFHVLQRNQVEIVNDSYGKGVIEGYEVPEDSEVEGEDYTTEDAGAINIQEIKDTQEEIHVDDDLKQNEPEDAGAINIQEIKDTQEEIHVDDDLKQNEPEVYVTPSKPGVQI